MPQGCRELIMELESALLIVPPRQVQAFAYPIREEHDAESFSRVPAHITLLYPFVSPDEVDEAAEQLKKTCAGFPPFELTLDQYGRFEDALFLEPSDPQKIDELYQRLLEVFPDYPAYKGEHDRELRFHLTLARFEDAAKADKIELPPTPSFTFEVKQLHLYLGSPEEDTPFIPRAVIPLGKQG
jgi:2'-5' RNA ligase